MKILLGPTNFSNQPVALTRALRERGIDARHLLYVWNKLVPFGYDSDEVLELDRARWLPMQLERVAQAVSEGYDVVHLWNRTLVFPPGGYGFGNGLDLPALRASGARIVYRFTGYDLRRRSLDAALNPYSPFNRGYRSAYEERMQEAYLEMLREYVECFVVQDPEMHAFLPEAEIVPRAIDLKHYAYVGAAQAKRPLVVHAPSNPELKGTDVIVRAVQRLQRRGVQFDFKLIQGLDHEAALEWYRRADVVVDQLLIGWYGVLAVEGMALGKPVVAHIRPGLEDSLEPSPPVVRATVETLEDTLDALLADRERREELGRLGRGFVEAVHDIHVVAGRCASLYETLGAAPFGSAPGVEALGTAWIAFLAATVPPAPGLTFVQRLRLRMRLRTRLRALLRRLRGLSLEPRF